MASIPGDETNRSSGFTDYGSAKLRREPAKEEHLLRSSGVEHRSCGDFFAGRDWPVLLLAWLSYGMPLVSFGAGGPLFLCILAELYGLFIAGALACFSSGRGGSWMHFAGLCGFSSLFGMVLGLLLRVEDHGSDDFARSQGMVVLLILLYLLVVLALSRALPTLGCSLIGSSAGFAEKHGWGWNPRAASSMQFGCDCRSLGEMMTKSDEDHPVPEEVVLDLLRHRCYWSGELAFDYVFHLANEHSFIGVLLAHPASPYEKYERALVLLFVCVLIIFPTAAFTVAVKNSFLRGVITLILVTAPRNLLRLYIKRIVIADEEILMKELQEEHAVQEAPAPVLQPPEVVAASEHDDRSAERHAGSRWQMATRAVMRHGTSSERPTAAAQELGGQVSTTRSRKPTIHMWQMWRQAASKVRADKAFVWEVTFFSVGFVVIVLIIVFTCVYVKAHSKQTLGRELVDAMVGLAWAFILELIFDLLICHRSSDRHTDAEEKWFIGFLHRWRQERDEYIKKSTQ